MTITILSEEYRDHGGSGVDYLFHGMQMSKQMALIDLGLERWCLFV